MTSAIICVTLCNGELFVGSLTSAEDSQTGCCHSPRLITSSYGHCSGTGYQNHECNSRGRQLAAAPASTVQGCADQIPFDVKPDAVIEPERGIFPSRALA